MPGVLPGSLIIVAGAMIFSAWVTQPQSPLRNDPVVVSAKFDAEGLSQFLAPVAIGDHTFWCSIDSGGSWVLALDTAKAQAAGLRPNVSGTSAGIGPNVVADQRVRGVTVDIGGVTVPDMTILLRTQPPIVPDIDCVFGLDILHDYVVEFDYTTPRLRIFHREAFRPPPGINPLHFELDGNHNLHIGANLTLPDGTDIAANLIIDSGASTYSAALMKPFVDAHAVADRIGPVIPEFTHTLGLALSAARAKRLNVGEYSIPEPVIALVLTPSAGVNADGLLGAGFLKRFTVTVDYANKLLWLVPNTHLNERQSYDASGIEFGYGNDGSLIVEAVAQDSAAAAADLKPGDRLLQIDDRKASAVTLGEIKSMISLPDTTQVLRIDRRGETRIVVLRLKSRL